MKRLFQYSLERERPIRLMWQEEDGSLVQSNVQILSYTDDHIVFQRSRPKKVLELPLDRLLSADFKKGDEGEG